MAQEFGSVTTTRDAVMQLRLTSGEVVECVIDTGFTGALMLPRTVADLYQLPVVGREVFTMVAEQTLAAEIVLAEVEWLGVRRVVRVIVSEGADALIGTEMLVGTLLVIDYVAGRVTITTPT